MLRSRILKGLILAAFAGAFASQAASCTLDTGGTKPPVITGGPCTVDANCDDGNPCTTEICPAMTLVCEFTKQTMGSAPTAAQTPADCKTIVCTDGEDSEVDDPQDSINDNNTCTTDACVGGKPTNVVLADNAPCKQGNKDGQCQTGTCTITCVTDTDCNDGNTCSDDLCNTASGTCVYTNLDGIPTPGSTLIVGDCKLNICNNGLDVVINDDADINEDNNPCTFDVCNAGVPENNNVPDATACTPGDVNVCDGNGACVECTVAAHCVGITETECEKRSCVSNKCEIAYEGQTTLASATLQVAKDCKKVVCNGAAGVATIEDNADLPVDGNNCTKDICTGGVPTNPPEIKDFDCGANQVCDGAGSCVGCTMDTQCVAMEDFCKKNKCINNVCGFSYTADGTDLPTGQTAGDCKVLECNATGSVKTSVLTSDVPIDGNACTQDVCNAQGTPSNPATPINSPCSVGMNDACDGNKVCKKALGKTCGAGTECAGAICVDGVCCNNTCTTLCRSCNVAGSVGTCADVPKGQDDTGCSGPTQSCNIPGDCDDENGEACAGNGACLSNFCADSVCCESACNTTCKSCNVSGGTPGQCANLPAGSTDNAPTNLCVGSNQCDGMGICKKVPGTVCSGNNECLSGNCVDGVCCNTMCTADCMACNVAGSIGVCSNVAMGVDDGGCSGATESCDGTGACKTEQGGACVAGTECFSMFCVDGVCCNTACDTACKSCNVSGNVGTCEDLPAMSLDTVPTNLCIAPNQCDGNGLCKKTNSTMCAADTECLSGNCVDGVCCNATCTADCKSCNVSGSIGTCSNVGTGVDDGMCTGMTESCDGMGVCKLEGGATCAAGSDCFSSFCVDGVCCNNACGTTCQACNVTGNVGTCTDLPLYADDTFPVNACEGTNTCNGSGACLLENEQPCSAPAQCASNKCPGGMVCKP